MQILQCKCFPYVRERTKATKVIFLINGRIILKNIINVSGNSSSVALLADFSHDSNIVYFDLFCLLHLNWMIDGLLCGNMSVFFVLLKCYKSSRDTPALSYFNRRTNKFKCNVKFCDRTDFSPKLIVCN